MSEAVAEQEDVRLCLGVPLARAVRSDTGRVRANNEDAWGTAWLADGTLLVTVCDGMGGHEAGEVASQLAVEVIEQVVSRGPEPSPQATLHAALLAANQAILDESRQAGRRGMGTTAVLAWVRGAEVHVGLVGDSRLYHVRGGRVLDRTTDHTRVQSLVDRGIVRPEEAREHPEAGMLTRALGHPKMSNGRPLEPEVFADPLRLAPGDALVLSTDGLHDLVDDWEIGATVAGETPDRAARMLVDLALERGGHDNVTVAVVVHGAVASDPERVTDEETAPVRAIPLDLLQGPADTLPPVPEAAVYGAPAPSRTVAPVAPAPPAERSLEDRLLLVAAFVGAALLVLSVAFLALAAGLAL